MEDQNGTEPAPLPPIILEEGKRLSESMLWALQRRFFEQAGMLAWADGIVPHYITSNPFIARAYAEVLLGVLRDVDVSGNPAEPLYVVELGAGVGRFAFHLLRRLARSVEGRKARYVITDFVAQNVEALRSHPSLRPFVAAGLLDFAVFDAERDTEVRLLESGVTLSAGTLKNPLVVIANYFFDGIPHDVFRVEGGQLHEGLVQLSVPAGAVDDPELLARFEMSFTHRPLSGAPFGDPDLDAILLDYQERLGRTSILFPSAGVRCLRALRDLAGGRLLVISGDKGVHREEDLLDRQDPVPARHGSLSLTVNYHALARYVEAQGGRAVHVSRGGDGFEIVTLVLDRDHASYTHTRRAYEEVIDRLGPDDFFTIKKAIERQHQGWTAREILSWLRLSGWDHNITLGCLPALLPLAGTADPPLRLALRSAVHEIWDAYFPIGERRDLAFALAALLFSLEYFDDALSFYELSLKLYGPTALTAYNMAMCHHRLHRLRLAQERVDEALALDPGFEDAKALRIRLRAEAATGVPVR